VSRIATPNVIEQMDKADRIKATVESLSQQARCIYCGQPGTDRTAETSQGTNHYHQRCWDLVVANRQKALKALQEMKV